MCISNCRLTVVIDVELFEARSALEVTIIRLAASRITPEEFEQLQAHMSNDN